MEKERNYLQEIDEFIEKEENEISLPEEAIELLKDGIKIYELEVRVLRINEAALIFEEENLDIPIKTKKTMQIIKKEQEEQKKKVQKALSKVLPLLSHKKMMSFLTIIEKKELREPYKIFLQQLTEEHKKTIYQVLHSEKELSKQDRMLIHEFEQRIGYTFDFAKDKLFEKLPKEMEIFYSFFETYVKEYNAVLLATLRWLQQDVSRVNLNEKMRKQYAEVAVRRLKIGEHIEDAMERNSFYDMTALEFSELLREFKAQKKSS